MSETQTPSDDVDRQTNEAQLVLQPYKHSIKWIFQAHQLLKLLLSTKISVSARR